MKQHGPRWQQGLSLIAILILALPSYTMGSALFWGPSTPAYNQLDPKLSSLWANPSDPYSSKLCVPVAALMGIEAQSQKKKNIRANSFSGQLNSRPAGLEEKVQALANLFNTNLQSGTTYNNLKQFAVRGLDHHYHRFSWTYLLGAAALKTQMLPLVAQGQSIVMGYGHYQKQSHMVWGKKINFYKRTGGHAVSVVGAMPGQNDDSEYLLIIDPWSGKLLMSEAPFRQKDNKQIHQYPAPVVKVLSYSEKANYLGIVEFVSSYMGI